MWSGTGAVSVAAAHNPTRDSEQEFTNLHLEIYLCYVDVTVNIYVNKIKIQDLVKFNIRPHNFVTNSILHQYTCQKYFNLP